MAHVANGDYEMVGTFNGNPLAMAAARAMLCEVATPEAYQRIERAARRGRSPGSSGRSPRHGLPAHVVSVGAKGCVVFAPEPVRDFRGFLGIDDAYSHAHWLFQHNGGVFLPPWGKIEQWLISVQHDEADIDRFVQNFGAFAAAIGWQCMNSAGDGRRIPAVSWPMFYAARPCAGCPLRSRNTCN